MADLKEAPHAILRAAASRAVLAVLGFLRAIPDLVWGLLFVTAVGLGSLAGTLALAVSYAGVRWAGSTPMLSPRWFHVRSKRCRPSEQRVRADIPVRHLAAMPSDSDGLYNLLI